jgi:hypothetical protein
LQTDAGWSILDGNSCRKTPGQVMVLMQRKGHLMEMILALQPPSRFARFLNRRK